MKKKKIISVIVSTLTLITLTGCNFGKNNINKESNQNKENIIEKQEQNNTELDKKSDEETEEKKIIEEENKEIKKAESDKEKTNVESKREGQSKDLPKIKVEDKKKVEPKVTKKPKYQEKREYKKEIRKEYPKQSKNENLKSKEKKEPIKEKEVEPKKNIPEEKKIQQMPKQTNEVFITEIEQMIFKKVNEERRKLGISPLVYNYTMQKYARDKSLDMGSKNYFSHEDLKGKLITENMKKDGVSFNAWGENIGYIAGYTGNANISNQFMNRWMNSTGHRKNILSQNFKGIGIGVYKIGNKYYATQEFYR